MPQGKGTYGKQVGRPSKRSPNQAQGRIDPDAMVSRGKGTSSFQMKYQGKHSAFPFKSPMKQNYHRAAVGMIGRDEPKKFKETKVGKFLGEYKKNIVEEYKNILSAPKKIKEKAEKILAKRKAKIHKKQGKA